VKCAQQSDGYNNLVLSSTNLVGGENLYTRGNFPKVRRHIYDPVNTNLLGTAALKKLPFISGAVKTRFGGFV